MISQQDEVDISDLVDSVLHEQMREDPRAYEMRYDLPVASTGNYSSVFQTLTTQEDQARERRGRSKDKSRPRSRS